jgi:hypothetical protein
MIQSGEIEGHIDESTFVRTAKKPKFKKIATRDASNIESVLLDLLRGTDTVDVSEMEKRTGVDRTLLRRTLIILLGEGMIQGTLDGNLFALDERMNSREFAEKLVRELRELTN